MGVEHVVWDEDFFHDTLHHLLSWDTELIIDDPVDESEEGPEV